MNRSTYLLVYNDKAGTYEQVKQFIDSRKEIVNWYVCLPHCFFIVSALSTKKLSDLFLTFTKRKGRFIIVNVTKTERNGWLPKKAWDLMRNPKAIGDE